VSSGFGGGSGFGSNPQQNTGFGSSSTGTGLFGGGSNAATSGTPAFGSNSAAGGAFGSGGGGGLFGQKPASTGGLFGSTTSQPAQSGGLFGSAGTTTSTFGNTGTNTGGFGSSTGGGLFGSSSATQNKPSGFSFGNNTATPSAGFGNTNTAGAFGSNATGNTGGGMFGNTTQNTGASGGLFGGGQTQQSTGSAFGTGGFGQNQQKPGGLFGAATGTGSSLFGGGNASTSAFGPQSSNTSTGGGLFGQKPATGTTTGGLFGGVAPQNTGTGGGLFGGGLGSSTQNQQPGQSLFSMGQNQNKSIFGGPTTQPSGGLFGNQGTQPAGSVFGGGAGQQQQPQNSLLGSSLLGGSQGANAAPQSLTASIGDVSAYGTPSLFSSQPGQQVANPGPLATPLSSKAKPHRSSILPMYKLNPGSARHVTPQKRGFGFSYSTYGTPGSPSSVASTPGGLGRSLLGSSLSRGLSKSVSTSSLRRSFNADDSILAPGAFSASSSGRLYGGVGSAKKFAINRDVRSDLFSTPTKDRPLQIESGGSQRKLAKRVSFDTSNVDADDTVNGSNDSPASNPGAAPVEAETPRAAASQSNGGRPEMEQVKGNELAIVHEEASPRQPQTTKDATMDKEPGDYWMSPSKADISNMNRMQRQKVSNFTIGRHNVGKIAFKAPVDLSNIDLDELYGAIIVLETRSATVYPIAAKKPPVGRGLNVPARISLEQSWPRGRDKRMTTDAKRFAKHVERLKRIENTEFEGYDKDTGIWIFSVEHFTTYGLDYDESDMDVSAAEMAHGARDSESPRHRSPAAESDADDTFDFRKKPRLLPGAFEQSFQQFDEDEEMTTDVRPRQSFLGDSSAGSAPHQLMLSVEEQPQEDDEYDMSENDDVTGSPLRRHHAAEHDNYSSNDDGVHTTETPGGILRARMRAIKESVAPVRVQVADGDDWMEMLQKTVSPQKRDRALLKSLGDLVVARDGEGSPTAAADARRPVLAADGRGFATSIDLMNSLFEKKAPLAQRQDPATSKGFLQWPYERQAKIVRNPTEGLGIPRPRWGPDGTLILATTSSSGPAAVTGGLGRDAGDVLVVQRMRGEAGVDGVVMAKFSNELAANALHAQIRMTGFGVVDGVPAARLKVTKLASMFQDRSTNDPGTMHEKLVWELAGILFDDVDGKEEEAGEHQVRKARLSRFWRDLVADVSSKSVGLAKSNEEKAIACLAGHRIQEACKYLVQGKNHHLATLVALIGSSNTAKKTMREQLKEWHDANVLSEFTPPIRALYEILSGNVCVCEGKKGTPIEDRLESFVISDEFQLNWKQAFGLRLWYAIAPRDDISVAVRKFQEDVAQDREGRPVAWFAEQSIEPLWDDPDVKSRQDVFWGLLRLYSDDQTDLESIIRPENSQLSPLDCRLSWQLGQALVSGKKATYGDKATEKADSATLSFASQLVNEGGWLEATFVLLHLTDATVRAKAIQEHLCRHASLIGPEMGDGFTTLTETFKIPAAWIWSALALYRGSVEKDAAAEVQCLLRAGAFSDAHTKLVEQVAPRAVIERDYKSLADLLAQFGGREDTVSNWPIGGEVYLGFLELMRHVTKHGPVPTDLTEKLVSSLPSLQGSSGDLSPYNTAAVTEMGSIVARAIASSPNVEQVRYKPSYSRCC